MGFVRKLTGADKQAKAMNKQADAQIIAAKASADNQVAALNAAVQGAANAQRAAQARHAAEALAAESAGAPLAEADVALDEPVDGSALAVKRKRRAVFGSGTTASGVNI